MEIKALFFLISLTIACETDIDCNLGGRCDEVTKLCQCAKEWKGDDCSLLDLLPAELDNGYRPESSSSWGGKIVPDGTGKYHLYAAAMVEKCGLTTWRTNSEIVHAISYDKPTGPYHADMNQPIVSTFGHNPTVEKIKTSSDEDLYVMAHIGCGGETTDRMICFNGTTCDSVDSCVPGLQSLPESNHIKLEGSCDNPHWPGMHTSKSPDGPWTSVTPPETPMVIVNPNPDEASWHDEDFTNPSIWPMEDGSILMAYATGCDDCPISGGHKHIGLAYAKTWSGPYIDLTPKEPIFPFASEDPCIWVSPELGTYHILAHTDYTGEAEKPWDWKHVSAHAFATQPEGPWIVSATPPYNRTIEWVSGETSTVTTRERPQVIFFDGVPSLLVNGVRPGNYSSPFTPNGYSGDWSYTHVQAIRT